MEPIFSYLSEMIRRFTNLQIKV